MQKIEFRDYPDLTTPLNATNLNQVQTNVENEINSVSTSLNNKTDLVEFTSSVTFNESVASNTHFYKIGNMCYVYFQGEGKTHSNNQVIANVPSAYRPSKSFYAPFVVNEKAYGNLSIGPNGNITINMISSTTTSGRIYANFSYPLD